MNAGMWGKAVGAGAVVTLGFVAYLHAIPGDDPPALADWGLATELTPGDEIASPPSSARQISDVEESGCQTGDASERSSPHKGTVDAHTRLVVRQPRGCADAPQALGAVGDPALIWKGFHLQWLRHVFGFQTPHRVSELGSGIERLDTRRERDRWTADVEVRSRFGPGEHGDLAFPETYFSGVQQSHVGVASAEIAFESLDRVEGDPPEATTRIRERVDFDLDRPELAFGAFDTYEALLQGFEIDSRCEPGAGPSDADCHSDGMWAHRMYYGVDGCYPRRSKLSCEVTIDIARGWTPTRGAYLQSLSERMRLAGKLQITIIGGDRGDFASRRGDELADERPISRGHLIRQASLTGMPGFDEATVGLSSFGYELQDGEGSGHPGRYMTSLGFGLSDGAYEARSGQMLYQWTAGFAAPVTVFDAEARYRTRPVLLQFDGASLLRQQAARSVVCRSGLGFACAESGRAEETSTAERLEIEVPY